MQVSGICDSTIGCGHGVCLNGTCVCQPGFRYDYTWILCPNCYLPSQTFTILLSLLATFSFMICLFLGWISTRRIDVVRRLIQANALVCLFNGAMMIALYVENRPGRITILFEFVFLWIFTVYMLPTLLLTLVEPVMQRQGQSLDILKHRIYMGNLLYTIVVITYYVLFCVYVNDLYVWNILFQTCSLFLCTHVTVICYMVRIKLSSLLKTMDEAIHVRESQSDSSTGQVEFAKLKQTRNVIAKNVSTLTYMLPVINGCLFVFALVYFIHGCFPYMFIGFTGIHTTPAFMGLIVSRMGKKRDPPSHPPLPASPPPSKPQTLASQVL